jgi:hypothetical protein
MNRIDSLLGYLSIDEYDHLIGKDITDMKNENDIYFSDLANEWVDSEIHIWNNDLWDYAPIFQDWTEDGLEDGCINSSGGLMKIFQEGEGNFYNRFVQNVFEIIEKLK